MLLRLRILTMISVLFTLLTACGGDGGTNGEVQNQSQANIPANAIQISIEYAPESEQYMPEIIERFNQAYVGGSNPLSGQPLASGERPIFVTGNPPQGGLSSGGVMQGIVNAALGANVTNALRPTIYAPSVSHWLSLGNIQKSGLFDVAEARATAISPVVIAIWESRLKAIQDKIGREDVGWKDLLDLLNSENGWADYGIPNGRRAVYYGHADPRNSSTALSALIGEFYACARNEGFGGRRLELEQVYDESTQECVRQIQQLVKHYSRRTEDFLEYIAQGPDYLDFVAVEEGDIICLNTGGRQGDEVCNRPSEKLIALYPEEGTFWHEHSMAVVNADWVTAEQRAAANTFIDFVLLPPQQKLIMSYGFRPANQDVALEAPFLPENGISIDGPSNLIDIPEPEVLIALQESWSLVRKQADIILLIDVSGSMSQNDKIGHAKEAALAFLENMEGNNHVGLYTFSSSINELVSIDLLESNRDRLRESIQNLVAEGGTELYAATRDVVNDLNDRDSSNRIRAVVVLSDGADTGERGITLNDTLIAINSSRDTRNPVIVVPVAYGSDADIQILASIARASLTRVITGDVSNIQDVLSIISSYF